MTYAKWLKFYVFELLTIQENRSYQRPKLLLLNISNFYLIQTYVIPFILFPNSFGRIRFRVFPSLTIIEHRI